MSAALSASMGSLLFVSDTRAALLRRTAIAVAGGLAVFVVANTVLVHGQLGLLRPIWVKGALEGRGL